MFIYNDLFVGFIYFLGCLCVPWIFYDIYVPVHLLPSPSISWIGKCPDADDLAFEWTDESRILVQSANYPPIPVEQPEDAKPFAPMVVTVSFCSELYHMTGCASRCSIT
ncbi:DNA-directed RNA polymerase III subunit RPC8-like [Pyrus ussuriensis x Pyrus communis]|uniref:DNA-directed RNA polymerase III subunit RPC8-like n=1 Tax=Pyrus ussuriensis x Pyrus communis TaxID=2448454 RepID=A0A5N5HGN1_9ROSA|nr:DNA-directed RNA polymerase III subunit RPC8-like [Pyrus ussuriensis x Pyrus communis]